MIHSLRTKIILLVLACILLTSIAIGGTGFINSKKAISSDSSQIMNLLCANKAGEINALLSRIEQSVNTLSVYALDQIEDPERFQTDQSYIDTYSDHLTDVAINAALNTEGAMAVYIRMNPEFASPTSGLFYTRETSAKRYRSVAPTDLSLYEKNDVSHVGWFYLPAENKKGTWLSPYMNENINVEMISYVVPFYIDETLAGVVGMDIDFQILKDIVIETTLYENGFAFLCDNNANVVYHRNIITGSSLLELDHEGYSNIAMQLQKTSSKDQLYEYTYQNSDWKIAFHKLDNGMRFIVTAPSKEIDAQASHLVQQVFFSVFIIILLSIFLTIIVANRLIRPLLELNIAAKRIAAGDLDLNIMHRSKDEIGTLAESFRQTASQLHKYISYINELAYLDPLTGVRNKTAYLEAIRTLDSQIRLNHPTFSIVVFDINNLKLVNDTYGHERGDTLIADSCKLICRVFRKCPIYRIGGDEFVTILEISDSNYCNCLLEEFSEEINSCNASRNDEIIVSIARGIATFSPDHDFSFSDVFKRADEAMYQNKTEQKKIFLKSSS